MCITCRLHKGDSPRSLVMSFGFGFSASASSQSLFGGAGSSQSLFGSNPSSQSLFGGGVPGFGAQSSQSLFGGAASSQSLFGGAASSQSFFGSGNSSQSLFGAASSQSLFGAASSQSLFGGASSQSLFGAPSSQSFFGSTSSQSLFGAPQSTPSLWGASQSTFGQPAPALLGQPQQQPQTMPMPQLPRTLTDVVERLNPLHPESKFHAALYNVVPAADVSRYTRPATFDEKLWDKAVSQNPDPSRTVPVQANNFDDLLTRADMQSQRLEEHIGVLSRLASDLSAMEEDASTNMATKLGAYRRSHRELARKLLRIASAVDVAVARENGASMSQGETERKKRLDNIARALAAPAEFKDKLADLMELAESTELDRRVKPEVEIRDSRAAAAIKELLKDQLTGIQHLSEVCERADRDVRIMTEMLDG